MEEGVGTRYWCHMCMQMVNPTREAELNCPLCQGGFVEQMVSTTRLDEADSALSLWAPILLGMMGNPVNRPRFSQDRETNSVLIRRRSTAAFLQLLQGTSAGISSAESESDRERVILVNPFNQTLAVQGGGNPNQGQSSIGDYFIGHALDFLLQQLAENDPNRQGALPAKREAVEALPSVKIQEDLQCPICLDEFGLCAEAKEMPCKHKFHGGCILPWLELHSSCPVCRFELPADESKSDSRSSSNGNPRVTNVENRSAGFLLPWPLNVFSSSSASRGNSFLNQSASSSGATSRADGD